MAIAVAEAGIAAGLIVVMLPAAYHRAGWDGGDLPPGEASGGSAIRRSRPSCARGCAPRPGRPGARVQVGVAAHSVRAVPAAWLGAIAAYADRHGLVRHVHAAEQPREIEECAAEHGCSPIELLQRTGFLGERTSVVHGIHVSDRDIDLLAASGTIVVSCPTTEGNLGDGRPPALAYRARGSGSRWEATPRSGSIPSRRCASWRAAREGRASPGER